MLSNLNFIRRNGKRKGAKSAKAHETHRRQPSPTSPSSFASPEIFDINEKSQSLEYRGPEESGSVASGSITQNVIGTPLVHLNLSPDLMEDWFPQELLQGRRSSRGSGATLGITAASQSNTTQESLQQPSSSSSSKQTVDLPSVEETEKISETIDHRGRDSPPRPGIAAWKKSIPAPIIIPDANHLVPNVQIGHSAATAEAPPLPTPEPPAVDAGLEAPPSPVSSEGMSAVSGTTLARALIANSFVLSSSEHRTSRHRSGMARQDSATLPRGDNPFLNSPYWRDKRTSGGDVVSGRTSPIPPVPPLPAGATLEQKGPRRSSSVRSQGGSNLGLTRRRSGSSTASEYPMSDPYMTSPEAMLHSGGSWRISRIVEVPSPAPTTPATPPPALALDTKAKPSGSFVPFGRTHGTTAESEESDMPNTASEIPSSADSRQASQQPSAESSHTEPFSPSPTDHSLDEYQFVPPGPQTAAITPGSGSSASYIAPLPPKRSNSNHGRRRHRADGPTVPTAGGRTRMDVNRSVLDASFRRNKKKIRPWPLPIGDQSSLVPKTPITPALIASSIVAPYSTLSRFPLVPVSAVPAGHLEMPPTARDNPDTSALVVGSIFASHQHHAALEPLTIDADCTELLNDALTVSPNLSNTSRHTPTSSSAGYQTFPETPMVFTPLWSPDYSLSSGSILRFPNERLQNVRSTTVPDLEGVAVGSSLLRTMTAVHRLARKGDKIPGEGAPVSRGHQSAVLPIQKAPSPKPDLSDGSVPAVEVTQQVVVNGGVDVSCEAPRSSPIKTEEVTDFVGPAKPTMSEPFRPHPLAHISTSSSQLQAEEALQAFARHSASSMPSIIATSGDPSWTPFTSPPIFTESYNISPASVPLPESTNTSPLIPPASAGSVSSTPSSSSNNLSPSLPPQAEPSRSPVAVSQFQPSKSTLSVPPTPLEGSSFLPSVSPTPSSLNSPVDPPPPRSPSHVPVPPSPALSTQSVPLSFVAPPPYHTVVSERTVYHPSNSSSQHSLSRTPSSGPSHERDRQPSFNSSPGQSSRNRVRARPPLPSGPRKPSGPAQPFGVFAPGLRERNNSVSSVGSSNHGAGSSSPTWHKLYTAASKPPPKFQTPPPKWRGLTMEAAQWTFTSSQLQAIVSRAIKHSAEGSSIRLLRLDTLDGEIADETHRLEMHHTDIKTQYKAMVRKRWTLMGALAGHIEGAEMNDTTTAIRTMEELSEVSLALDQLADELHSTIEQLAQLKNMRDVHHGSALAMALRKVNSTFLKQMSEKEKLHEHIEILEAERDEAWKHAEDVAQDYDNLNDRMMGSTGEPQPNDDARSTMSSRRSIRVSAVRRSSVRQSKAGLRTLSRHRSRRSSVSSVGNRGSMSFPTTEDIPPVPPLPLNQLGGFPAPISTGMSSSYSVGTSAARALAQAQQELYDMLGLNVQDTPSEASSRPRTISGPQGLSYASFNLRPMSEGGTGASALRPRAHENRATHSAILDSRQAMLANLGMMTN